LYCEQQRSAFGKNVEDCERWRSVKMAAEYWDMTDEWFQWASEAKTKEARTPELGFAASRTRERSHSLEC
jgi:hypothetical protein